MQHTGVARFTGAWHRAQRADGSGLGATRPPCGSRCTSKQQGWGQLLADFALNRHQPEGEWSVPTLSMMPSARPCSRRCLLCPSRSGGAHLNLPVGAPGKGSRHGSTDRVVPETRSNQGGPSPATYCPPPLPYLVSPAGTASAAKLR